MRGRVNAIRTFKGLVADLRVNLYEDDDKLNTRTKVRTTHKKIKAGDKLTLKLKSSGGAALHFTLAE